MISEQFFLLGRLLSADNPSYSRYQVTVQGTYTFSPILSGSLAGIYYLEESAPFLSPSITWSVI